MERPMQFPIKNGEKKYEEWFLFLSNNIDLADQIEGLHYFLEQNEDLELGRILTFINAQIFKDLTRSI